ncbi:MAG: chaperone modulator CbpM [Syntrophomonadaceae bacterium]|nr:chaperone modulator CbpM [Syntrophomonadaceae bacterium]
MKLIKVFYHNQDEELPISQLDFHPELLQLLEEMGILEIRNDTIDARYLQRINKMMRLKNLLGVNLNGAAIIVDLLDRIKDMEQEIEDLKETR